MLSVRHQAYCLGESLHARLAVPLLPPLSPRPTWSEPGAGGGQGLGTPGAAGHCPRTRLGQDTRLPSPSPNPPSWGLDGTSLETEAACLRSICHYGNKVARPFFLLLFLLRFHYLMQMRPLKKSFCRVAHAGTSSIEGFIACFGLQTDLG